MHVVDNISVFLPSVNKREWNDCSGHPMELGNVRVGDLFPRWHPYPYNL